MNTFNADDLLGSPFSNCKEGVNVRPFSPKTEALSSKLYSSYEDYTKFDDESFLSYIVLLDRTISNGMSCNPVMKRSIMDSILSLQSLLYRQSNESWNISQNILFLAKQLFFKACAEYLVFLKSGPSVYSHVLHSLSYQCGKKASDSTQDFKAFSSSMSLVSIMSLALVEFSNMQTLWENPELADKIVQELIPEDGAIRRLRTALITTTLSDFSAFNPNVNIQDITNHSENILPFLGEKDVFKILILLQSFPPTSDDYAVPFTPLLVSQTVFKSLAKPQSMNLQKIDSHSFTQMDAELYLVWTMLWCRLESPRCSRHSYQALPISNEQYKLWQAIVSYVEGNQRNPAILLRIQKVMESVRLRVKGFNLKLAFAVFRWMRRAEYVADWTDLYAHKIGDAIANCILPSRSSDNAFVVTTPNALIDVEEEAIISAVLLKYNVGQCIAAEQYADAERLLLTSKSTESKKDLSKLYEHWSKFAVGTDRIELGKKMDILDSDLSSLGLKTPKINFDESVVSSRNDFLNDTISIFLEEGKSPEDIITNSFKKNIKFLSCPAGNSKNLFGNQSPTVFSSPLNESRKTNNVNESFASADASFHSLKSEATTIANHSFASALESPYKEGNSFVSNSSPVRKNDPIHLDLDDSDVKEADQSVALSQSSNLDIRSPPVVQNEEQEDMENFYMELIMLKLENTRKMMDNFSKRNPV
ncbi:unnamed protein product [Auanema sp. JU1783]|nr:unnamed protein product [Auanema sp. JU1783]